MCYFVTVTERVVFIAGYFFVLETDNAILHVPFFEGVTNLPTAIRHPPETIDHDFLPVDGVVRMLESDGFCLATYVVFFNENPGITRMLVSLEATEFALYDLTFMEYNLPFFNLEITQVVDVDSQTFCPDEFSTSNLTATASPLQRRVTFPFPGEYATELGAPGVGIVVVVGASVVVVVVVVDDVVVPSLLKRTIKRIESAPVARLYVVPSLGTLRASGVVENERPAITKPPLLIGVTQFNSSPLAPSQTLVET